MATSKIQILIEADDKASAKLKALAAGMEETENKTKKAAISFKTFRDASAAVAIAIFSVKKGLDATLGAAISYNKAMLDGARAASISTDEMSRIVQAADDYGISMGEVTGAMELAQKRGFAPTIENLANLADETNAILSPTERAAKLAEVLGRNWATLNPLLQQGGARIRELTASVADNLVVTEAEAKKTEEMRLRIDELSDAWTGAKLSAGNFLAEGLLPIIDGIKGVTTALDEQAQRIFDEADTYEDYSRIWEGNSMVLRLFGGALTEAEFRAAKLAPALDNVGREAHGMGDRIAAAAEGIPPALEEVTAAVEAFHPPSIWDEIFPSPADLAQRLQEQIDFIQAGGPGLVAAMENVQSALTTGAITPEQAEAMLEPISAAAAGLDVQLGNTTMWEAARARAKEIGIPFSEARQDIEAGVSAIASLPQEIDIRINWLMENPVPPGGQHGLDMTVPPGFPNDSYPIMASSGERVVVIPQSTSNQDNRTFNFTANGAQGQEDLLAKFQRDARRS